MQPRFKVVEYSSFFAVRDTKTGQEAHMGDGVDSLSGPDGEMLSPGTPGFCETWASALNEVESVTLRAYFPHTYYTEEGR